MNDWGKVVISPDCSIAEAVKFIDAQGERIALVVDPSSLRLLGTITDGDIRRGLLRGIALEDSCQKIMCDNPICASPNITKTQLRALFDKHQIIHIPLVDKNNIICGLETLQEHIHLEHKRDNPVFIMAGGFGTRLQPLTNTCPKPLLKIGDKPILQLILENFIKNGFYKFYISTHYMPEMIQSYFGDGSDWNVSIEYIHEEQPLDTGGALGLLPHENIHDALIMMNGDLLTNVNFIELLNFHDFNNSFATICVRPYEYQVPFGVIKTAGQNVMSIEEKPIQKFNVNAGIYVLSPKIVRSVQKNQKIDMPTLLRNHIKTGETVTIFPVHEYWLDIGRKEDFTKAQVEVEDIFGE